MLAVSTNSLMCMLMYCTLLMTEIIAAKANESQQHSKNLIELPFQPNELLSNSQYIFSHDVQWSCFGSHSNSIVLKNCCRIERIFCSKSGPSLSFSKCATFDGHSLSIAPCRHYFQPGRHNVTASGHTLLPISLNDLNESMCAPLNRKGLVCRECIHGFGLSVTSFKYKCINCTAVWYSIPLFLFLEFFPVTVSYLFILAFRISITSPPMPCFIMFAQFFIYLTDDHHFWTGIATDDNGELTLSYKVLRTVYGFFNLDFFRYLPPPLCLGSWLKPIHIAFFRIFTSFYPLFLIFLTWVCVKLHNRNVRLIVCLWRPFHKCFVRLRKGWDSKSDLVDVFITFFILTYYKFVYITTVVSFNNEKVLEVDLSGNISYISLAEIDLNFLYYSKSYISIAVISAMLYLVYILLPPLLLILYPIKMFRSCLSKCCLNSLTITIFTDKIQSCYRNGLDGGRDMRSFSAFYFYLRLFFHTVRIHFGKILKETEWTSLGVTYSLSALIVALIRPYRKTYMNICDSLLLINIAMMCFSQFKSTITTFLLYTPVVGLVVLLVILRVNVKKLSLPFIIRAAKAFNHFRARLKSFLQSRSLKSSDNHRKNFPTDAQSLILAHAAEHINYGSYRNS